jgi:hypothetical protein
VRLGSGYIDFGGLDRDLAIRACVRIYSVALSNCLHGSALFGMCCGMYQCAIQTRALVREGTVKFMYCSVESKSPTTNAENTPLHLL